MKNDKNKMNKAFSDSVSEDEKKNIVEAARQEHRDAYGRNIKDWLLINGKYRPHP